MKTDIKKSSGNVFEDLGLSNSVEALAKAELARKITNIIANKKLTQNKAATLLGIDQAKVSALTRGQLKGFSTDRLFRLLNALGQDIEIRVTPMKKASSQAGVHVAGV
jgi:predicted XRE-type DNA-binding protein